jgi:hypothetical protein
MGRLTHLTRLALGRSPFEDLETNQDVDRLPARDDPEQRQQYDSKGRPINQRTLDTEAEVRHAQNEILELVGVVEKKDKMVQDEGAKYQDMRQLLRQKMKLEDDIGRGISTISEFVCPLLRMWVVGFIARLQTGIYPSDLPLSEILAHEWHGLTRDGLVRGFPRLFLGLGSIVLWDNFLDREWSVLSPTLRLWIGGLQSYVLAGNLFRQATERRILSALPSAVMGLTLMLIDRELLPIMIYADAQRLGFAPVDPPFCPPQFFTYVAAHRQLWKPLKSNGRLSALTSPAVLMLLYRSCFKCVPVQAADARNTWSISTQSRVFQMFTSYRNQAIDDGYKQIERPKFFGDPFGWILHQNYQLRTSLLESLGWNMTNCQEDRSEQDDYDCGRLVQDDSARFWNLESVDKYRSTSLAYLPAQFLATRIDYWMANILLLPLSSTILRSVAKMVMKMHLLGSREEIQAAGRVFAPFGGGPFGQLIASRGDRSAWADVCIYSGRLCFGATLYMAVDILAFGMLCGAVKTIGVGGFRWGSKPSAEVGLLDKTSADPV